MILAIFLAYIGTGVALLQYDLAAPPLHMKGYILQRQYGLAAIVSVLWPINAVYESWQEHKLGRSGARLFFGVLLLAIGMYLWAKLCLHICNMFTDIYWLSAVITLLVVVVLAPLFAGLALPKHDQP